MTLKGMPVLHARTYNIDFRSKLLVRPKFFSDKEASYCYQIAVDSTTFRELAPKEGRTVIYGDGRFLVIGKTVVFADLYASCAKTPKYDHVDHENGRLAYGFVGMAFPRTNVDTPFMISDSTLLEIYENSIKERWNEMYGDESVFESMPSDFTEIEVQTIPHATNNIVFLLNNRSSKMILEDEAGTRNELYYNVEKRALMGESLSLCTSMSTEKAIRESCFDIVTCRNASSIVLNQDVDEAPQSNVMPVTSDINSNPKKTARLSNNPFGKMKKDKEPKDNIQKESSLDDLLNKYSAPVDEERSRFLSYASPAKKEINTDSSSNKKNLSFNFQDAGCILGAAFGVTFTLLAIAKKANPVILASTSAYTIVIVGIEAKRIIDKFK